MSLRCCCLSGGEEGDCGGFGKRRWRRNGGELGRDTMELYNEKNKAGRYINLHNALIQMYSRCRDIKSSRKLFDGSKYLDQISWNFMISGYLKCGSTEDAKTLFDSMPEKDVVSWSTMISGYAQHDHFTEALSLFNEMQLTTECKPDETILVGVVSACTHLAALEQGKWIHSYIKMKDLKINSILGTTLVDMYMKCGCVESALEVFHEMEEKGVSSWNAVIMGLAMNEFVQNSLDKFSDMKRFGVAPNEITFLGILGVLTCGFSR
ncbi:hypothetical protein GIB67_024053 [Kingdonia uniflora]|uniref:Pentatricopeptide repeat-containing protein n=1 Tax=Kingdonia uniflora TaxID=39325 RepID=A0A7J7LAT3_9MAGN|nr:hypothetical protein GIB67_024053 [Kingdonia uniflora]